MNILEILAYLDKHEIDYRLESNFCCGYTFYFLDASVYPRRYYDDALDKNEGRVFAESVEHMIARAVSFELKKDWHIRIEGNSLEDTFKKVSDHIEKSMQ